jgi:hypothetical protein
MIWYYRPRTIQIALVLWHLYFKDWELRGIQVISALGITTERHESANSDGLLPTSQEISNRRRNPQKIVYKNLLLIFMIMLINFQRIIGLNLCIKCLQKKLPIVRLPDLYNIERRYSVSIMNQDIQTYFENEYDVDENILMRGKMQEDLEVSVTKGQANNSQTISVESNYSSLSLQFWGSVWERFFEL